MKFHTLICAAFLSFLPGFAVAQEASAPQPPAPVQQLVESGAQIRYLGRHENFDGWLTIKNGQEQYFYAAPGGDSLFMGLLFDSRGEAVTIRQVQELQAKDGNILNYFAAGQTETDGGATAQGVSTAFKTPSEQLMDNVQDSNWIALGKSDAPVLYAFMDPQCPHCHALMGDLRKRYIETGKVQLRLIPVGADEKRKAQAAFLLAAPDPEQRWYRHLDGDVKALPAAEGINQQGVERNMAVMQAWKLDATPIAVYRAVDGKVKIVEGRPRDVPALIADLTGEKN